MRLAAWLALGLGLAAGSAVRAADVSGVVAMPELCAREVNPAVVWLEPLAGQPVPKIEGPGRVHHVDQRGLVFLPRVVALRAGDTVRFGNSDGELHNVHILGRGSAFNEGVPAGATASFVPNEAGTYRVVCDVHPHMRAYLVVADSPWVTACGADGRFRFEGVPPGAYRLRVWHEMGAELRRDVSVADAPLDLGRLDAPAGVNPTTRDDRAQMCERGCEPWPLVIDRIALTLAAGREASKGPDKTDRGLQLAHDAYYRDFETSGMGTAVRVHLGRQRSSQIEDLFDGLARDAAGAGTDAPEQVLGNTRAALDMLTRASEDLTRRGVTERSRIFTGTSPAFWVDDAPGVPRDSGAPRFGTLAVLGIGGAAVVAGLVLLVARRPAVRGDAGRRPRVAGVAVAAALAAGLAAYLAPGVDTPPPAPAPAPRPAPASGPTAGERRAFAAAPAPRATADAAPKGQAGALAPLALEHPIGLDVRRNQLKINAAWHRAVKVAGRPEPAAGSVHLAVRVQATEGNPNGFARGDWVPYLDVRYTVVPKGGGAAVSGRLAPVLGAEGPHYGANLTPPPGESTLRLDIAPPPDEVLGRFVDPTDGVAPWWKPFAVELPWSYRPGG